MSWLRTTGTTCRAFDLCGECNDLLGTKGRVVQVEIEPHRDITSAFWSSAPSSKSSTAEATAEELLENVLETTELAEEVLTAERLTPVVSGPLLWIREDLVRFCDATKAVLCLGIARVRIRMRLPGEPSKCGLDLVSGGAAVKSKCLVVALHWSSSKLFSSPSETLSTTRIVRR